ncbi:MAG: hypothetical protein ACREON_11370 [Gemmatimonadaceae bacterium]
MPFCINIGYVDCVGGKLAEALPSLAAIPAIRRPMEQATTN